MGKMPQKRYPNILRKRKRRLWSQLIPSLQEAIEIYLQIWLKITLLLQEDYPLWQKGNKYCITYCKPGTIELT
jgi:hypothetical protein